MEKVIGIFIEGLLSFFSPCVLPLVPLYMAYLSSSIVSKDGKTVNINQKRTFILTLCFVIGIFACFGLLSFSVNSLNRYIVNYKNIISLVGGILLIFFGLHQTGIIKISFLDRELRFDYRINDNKVSFIEAFMLGFVFSFAWTPCIGPMLTNAILLSMQDATGSLYIMVYGLGLAIPFLLTGIFTSYVINFIRTHKSITKYVSIISGIIVICFGIYMIYTSYSIVPKETVQNVQEAEVYKLPSNEFELLSGDKASLYSDKMVVLHYITSWCEYCKEDEPHFEDFCNNHNEITCYLVMNEQANKSQNGVSIKEFYDEYKPNLDIIIDDDLSLYSFLSPTGFPSTYFTDGEGNVLGLIPGAVYDKYEDIYNNNY